MTGSSQSSSIQSLQTFCSVVELSGGKKFCPFLRVVGAKDLKIGFNLLIGLFSLSIYLRIICDEEAGIIVE